MPVGNIPYNLNIPFATNSPSADQPNMLTNTNSTNTWTGRDHFSFSDPNAGLHQQVNLPAGSAPSVNITGGGVLYASFDGANTWPFWRNANGLVQIIGGFPFTASNGRAFICGGTSPLIIQWGRVTGLSGHWPTTDQTLNYSGPGNISFPVSSFSVYTSFIGPTSSSSGDICINALNKNNFHWQFTGSSSASFDGFYWLSIGN